MKTCNKIIFIVLTAPALLSGCTSNWIGPMSVVKSDLHAGIGGVALTINNDTDYDVSYFYTSAISDGQDRWYQHEISAHSGTWDWAWSNYNPQNSIEFVIHNGNKENGYA